MAGAIEDQQLMFDEEGLGKYGTDAVRTGQSGEGGDEMDEKDEEIAHFRMVARNRKLAKSGQISNSPGTGRGAHDESQIFG